VEVMLALLEITPFFETIFYDSDVLRVADCSPWEGPFTQHRGQSIVVFGRARDCGWHWGEACNLESRNHQHFPHTHAGMMYIRADDAGRAFFQLARHAHREYHQLGFQLFRNKKNAHHLEIHWSYAFGKLGWLPMEWAEQSLFSFNWRPGERLPPHELKVKNLPEPAQKPYCHVHQFYANYHAALFAAVMPFKARARSSNLTQAQTSSLAAAEQTRSHVGIVVASYCGDDLRWVDNLHCERFAIYIYSKCHRQGAPFAFSPHARPCVQLLQRANFGRDCETHLYHIVSHYTSLEPFMIFLQGTLDNYRGATGSQNADELVQTIVSSISWLADGSPNVGYLPLSLTTCNEFKRLWMCESDQHNPVQCDWLFAAVAHTFEQLTQQAYRPYRTALRCQFGVSSRRLRATDLTVYGALLDRFSDDRQIQTFPRSVPATSSKRVTLDRRSAFGIAMGAVIERVWNVLFSCWTPDGKGASELICFDCETTSCRSASMGRNATLASMQESGLRSLPSDAQSYRAKQQPSRVPKSACAGQSYGLKDHLEAMRGRIPR